MLQYLGLKQVEQGIIKKEYFNLHRNPYTLVGGFAVLNLEDKRKGNSTQCSLLF